MAKSFLDPYPNKGAFGAGDYIPDQSAFVTSDATEQSHTLQSNTYQVEIKNKTIFEGTNYSGDARISFYSGGTADSGGGGNSGRYLLLSNGESIVLDVAEYETIYFKRDAASDIALDIRERRL